MINELVSTKRRDFIQQSVFIVGAAAFTANAIAQGSSSISSGGRTEENTMPNTVESFPDMLRRVLGDRLKPEVMTFTDMFARDGVLEYPFAPAGLKTPLVGRDAIVANFQTFGKLFRVDSVTEVVVHETGDPQLLMIEFAGQGEGLITKEPYNQRYISVIRVRDGHIVHYKDYWNPLALLRAVKGKEIMKGVALD